MEILGLGDKILGIPNPMETSNMTLQSSDAVISSEH